MTVAKADLAQFLVDNAFSRLVQLTNNTNERLEQ